MLRNIYEKKQFFNFGAPYASIVPESVGSSRIAPFAFTYLCETAFYALVQDKFKSWNKLDVQNKMRLAISNWNAIPTFKACLWGAAAEIALNAIAFK